MCNYFIERLGRTCKLKSFKDDLCKCHYKMTTKCPICLDSLDKIFTTVCNHDFHESCINTWLETRNTCPMCRHMLIDRVEPHRNMNVELRNNLIDMFEYVITIRRFLNLSNRPFNLDLDEDINNEELYNNELEELNRIRTLFNMERRITDNEDNAENTNNEE